MGSLPRTVLQKSVMYWDGYISIVQEGETKFETVRFFSSNQLKLAQQITKGGLKAMYSDAVLCEKLKSEGATLL